MLVVYIQGPLDEGHRLPVPVEITGKEIVSTAFGPVEINVLIGKVADEHHSAVVEWFREVGAGRGLHGWSFNPGTLMYFISVPEEEGPFPRSPHWTHHEGWMV